MTEADPYNGCEQIHVSCESRSLSADRLTVAASRQPIGAGERDDGSTKENGLRALGSRLKPPLHFMEAHTFTAKVDH